MPATIVAQASEKDIFACLVSDVPDGDVNDAEDRVCSIELFMAGNGGIITDPDAAVYENRDFRPADPDSLVVGTTKPYAFGVRAGRA